MQRSPIRPDTDHMIQVAAGDVTLGGILHIPNEAKGMVIFAHGSGSSRLSPRNRFVAEYLQQEGLATLLFDLLNPGEEELDRITRHIRFDIGLLADRLASATEWLLTQDEVAGLKIGYFGASTGAAAALIAASKTNDKVHAIVSRGGRPDLAGRALRLVKAPTLLVVGGEDAVVLDLNKEALKEISAEKRLEIIPKANHLFEEEGALERVSMLAADWFTRHLSA